ncbi:MAG: DUF3105 domain-containing protein [Patescibacteria group bacterium]|nr:DUF3105 domain-containing protein [Patescibacteria group bacterium]
MSKYNAIIDISTERKVFTGIGLLTVLVLVGGVWLIGASDKKQQEKLSKPLMGEEIVSQGEPHVKRGETHPAYNSNPPTSGWHWGDGTAGPGIKDQPVPDELVLHSMEHGAAVVWYKSDLPKEDIEKITMAFNDVSGKKIMLPRQNLDAPVALTSWGRLLKLKSIDEGKIKEFITTNEDRGPEKAAI